jgi:hypothetical protein
MGGHCDPVADAAGFLRKMSFVLAVEDDHRALVALDHAIALEAEAGRRQAERIVTPDCRRIDPHRCDLGAGRHVLADGTVE